VRGQLITTCRVPKSDTRAILALGRSTGAKGETAATSALRTQRRIDLSGAFVARSLFALSVLAGVVHLAVVPEHWQEFRLFGIAFLLMAAFQLGWAAQVARAVSRDVLIAGLFINATLVALWTLSRTIGLPLGPESWAPEPVGLLDSLATASEIAIVVIVLIHQSKRTPDSGPFVGMRRSA